MTFSARVLAVAASCLFVSAVSAHAQMPTDNATWKARCQTLAAAQKQSNGATLPADQLKLTRGVNGDHYLMLALDRSHEGQHAVACTLFYLGAIADRSGVGGHEVRPFTANNELIFAEAEQQQMRGESPSFTVGLRRDLVQAMHMTTPVPSDDQVRAVLTAATTMPLVTTNAMR